MAFYLPRQTETDIWGSLTAVSHEISVEVLEELLNPLWARAFLTLLTEIKQQVHLYEENEENTIHQWTNGLHSSNCWE